MQIYAIVLATLRACLKEWIPKDHMVYDWIYVRGPKPAKLTQGFGVEVC